ncbi:MAG: LysR family transcriptional regulator [Alphaproteobacteria bacterium]|nr:LysR family transcriptional regulator [Alphaproteobacteria bacterium]MCB9796069.1 LysR family transcriptional regulator [Alphaproteobacteria bacterium]
MDLQQLEALVATAEEGSITGASEALGVSPPTLRARLDALEESLGVTLLLRTNRGVSCTETGERFLQRARRLLEELEALRLDTARGQETVLGELSVMVPSGSLPPITAVLMTQQLRMRHPELCLRVTSSPRPLEDAGPDVDLVLTFEDLPERAPFHTFALTRFPVQLLASADYLAAKGRPCDIESLAGHHLLCWEGAGGDGTTWPLRGGGHVEVRPSVRSTDVIRLRALAMAGLGIALVPNAPLAEGILPGEALERVLGEQIGREGVLRVLVRESVAGSARARAVKALLRELAEGLLGPDAEALLQGG